MMKKMFSGALLPHTLLPSNSTIVLIALKQYIMGQLLEECTKAQLTVPS